MKKRIFSILITLCMMLCLTPASVISVFAVTVDATAKEAYDKLVNDGVLPRDIPFDNFIDVDKHQKGSDIVIGNKGVYFITGSVTFSGNNPARIRVDKGVTSAVAYFYNCHMDYSQCKNQYAPVTVHAEGSANFHFLGNNTFIGSSERPGIEKIYKSGGGVMTLHLWDDCNVTATGGEFAAGIGSAYKYDGGGIIIEANGSKGNGKLTATGTNGYYGKDAANKDIYISGAGIGGSAYGSAYNITITGGDITAKGGKEAAGIGGGHNGNAGNILITGGKIEASSANYGAGIGTGACSAERAEKNNWLVCKDVTISGGKVTAIGGDFCTAAIGGGAGGKAENIRIIGGNVTALVRGISFGRVIGGGQDCTDISESITASLSTIQNAGQYYKVTLFAQSFMGKMLDDIEYRIYPGETFDIKSIIEKWRHTNPLGEKNGTYIPGMIFSLVNCKHIEKVTEDGTTYMRATDYYKTVGEDRVHFCDQCGSVLDYDNTNPQMEGEYSKEIIGDWNFRVTDPEPTTNVAKKFSYTNANGNTVDFIVPEKSSGIAKVLLDGNPLTANSDGSYTVPADSSLPDNVKKHTLSYMDRAGRTLTHNNFTVYEAITLSAFCDGEPLNINNSGSFEVQMGKGWVFKMTSIKTLGYNGYYKVYVNGKFYATCLQTLKFDRFYEDTRLDFYTEQDTEPPAGRITVGEQFWDDFDTDSRPDTTVFVNKSEKVIVTATDEQSGVDTVKYLISPAVLSERQLESEANWLDYTEPFALPTDKAYYVYVKVTDKTGKFAYINTAALRAISNPIEIVSVSGNPTEWQATSAEIKLTVSGDAPIATALVYTDGSTVGESGTVTGNEVVFSAAKNGNYRVVATDRAGNTAEKMVEVTRIDPAVPTVTITADEDIPRRSASVAVTVADSLSGYTLYLSHNGKAEQELTERTFTVTENGTYSVRAVNGAGTEHTASVTYTKIDRENPSIEGIEDGKTYCAAMEFTVSDNDGIASVTVNGTPLRAENGQYTLSPAEGEQLVVATDHAGNSTTITVIVNNGHTPAADDGDCTTPIPCIYGDGIAVAAKAHDFTGEWQTDDTHHWHECKNEGCTVTDTKTAHSGTDDGDCKTAIVCTCGVTVKAAQNEHNWSDWASNGDGTHEHHCQNTGCNATETNACSGGTATCTKKATCELCGEKYGELKPHSYSTEWSADETRHWHECTACGANADEAKHTDEDKDHRCDLCNQVLGECADEDKDHKCDLCNQVLGECADEDKDHKCDLCGKTLSEHSGGKATCTEKATCEICGEKYGEPDAANHTDLKHIAAKAATKDAEGHIEYWYCSDCDKYFSDKDGTNEITKADTVTAKLPEEKPDSPATGDNSRLALWIALLFISGGVVTATTVVGRKTKRSAE